MKLIFASHNEHKIKEIKRIIPDGYEVLGLSDIDFNEEIPETASTLDGNASQKSNYLFEKLKVNCFSDDTGLEVKSLNGEPGVYSARYAGSQRDAALNMDLLLKNLDNEIDRTARFRTVISLILDGEEYQFEGIVEGEILKSRTGSGGFGYDPIFRPNGFTRSFSEMTIDEKNKISHRARAFERLIRFLEEKRKNL